MEIDAMNDLKYRRPQILDRIPLNQHALIEASAGTGKTYTIENLVVEILLKTDATIDRIQDSSGLSDCDHAAPYPHAYAIQSQKRARKANRPCQPIRRCEDNPGFSYNNK